MDLNKVLVVGNLTRDPEVKYLPSGDPVAEFDIGMNRSYKDRSGELKKETSFVKIKVYGKTADFCSNYLQKGKAVFIEGRLKQDAWETPDGQKRSLLHIIADRVQFAYPRSLETGESYGGGQQNQYGGGAQSQSAQSAPPAQASGPVGGAPSETKDDLPF